MKKLILAFVISVLCSSAYASLWSSEDIQVECDTCSLVQDYEDTAWKHRKLYPDSTLYYCDLAIEESIRTSDTLGLAKLYNFKGIAYHYKGDNVGSYDYYLLAYNYAISHSDTLQMGHAMNNLGRFYSSQGNYTEAFDYCNRALDLFRDLNDLDGIAYSQKRISEMYLAQGYLQEALKITRESLQIRLDHFRDARQAHAHIDLARIFALLDISDSAFYHYQLAKEKGVAANDIVAMTNTELGLSELEIQLTNYRKGLTYAVNADELAKSYDNQDLKNRVSIQYGIALYLNSKINESEEEFMNVLQHSKASNQLELQKQAHLFLSKIYLKRNDGFKAYNHRVQYGEINDQLSQSEARRAIDSLLFIVELDRRKGDNVLLKATQEANEAVLAESKIRNILLSVVLVAVILFAYILWTNGRRTKQLNLDLTDKNSRINDQQKEISLQNNRLKERNLLLKEANTEKDFLMNVVAHDLKAPINNVLGISTLLKMSTPNKEQEELIDMLVTVSERNLALIRDLLDVSAFEENERKMNIQELDVLELLEDTISINQQVAELKNIEIKLLSESTGTKINSDKEYCSRIFNNLLSNAIKFSNPGDEVELSAIEKDSKVVVTIKDHGPGFTDDDKNNLYKKFTKLSARPTQGENSSGLGLALVKTLVNKLEAKIELESKEGEGSEFTLSFDI